MWKCANQELERQICCFPYVELSDIPRLQQQQKKPSDGRGISYWQTCSSFFPTSLWCMLRGEATNTNFLVFDFTRSGLEFTIYSTSVKVSGLTITYRYKLAQFSFLTNSTVLKVSDTMHSTSDIDQSKVAFAITQYIFS